MQSLNSQRALFSSAAMLFAVAVFLVNPLSALATERYVDVNSTNATPPYISWATAATNIQDAAPVVIGGQNVVINPISGPQQFYRLRH